VGEQNYYPTRRQCAARLGILSLGMPGASCALLQRPRQKPKVGPSFRFQVLSEQGANQNFPIAVDLVLVQDQMFVEKLAQMPASTWFAEREQIKRDSPVKPMLQVSSWEWTPGQKLDEPIPASFPARGWAAFLFAHYLAPGPHRVRLDSYSEFTLTLGQDTIQVVAGIKGKSK
jgi:type VI secretion system protein